MVLVGWAVLIGIDDRRGMGGFSVCMCEKKERTHFLFVEGV